MCEKLFSWLEKPVVVWVFLGLWLISSVLMFHPQGFYTKVSVQLGPGFLEGQGVYGATAAVDFLSGLSDFQKSAYLRFQFADFFFLLFQGLFFSALLLRVWRPEVRGLAVLIPAMPLIAGLADLTENVVLSLAIVFKPAAWVLLASLASFVKITAILLALGLLLVGLVWRGIRWGRTRLIRP